MRDSGEENESNGDGVVMIPACVNCGSREIEYFDAENGEYLPDWLVDARGILGWDTDCEPALLKWQEREEYTDEEMQYSVDGLINSERLSGSRPKGYLSVSKALQRRLNMGYDRPRTSNNGTNQERYPVKAGRYQPRY